MIFPFHWYCKSSRADIARYQAAAGIACPLRPLLPRLCNRYVQLHVRAVIMISFESHRSNHTKPAFKKLSALPLYLLEQFDRKISVLAALAILVTRLCELYSAMPCVFQPLHLLVTCAINPTLHQQPASYANFPLQVIMNTNIKF